VLDIRYWRLALTGLWPFLREGWTDTSILW
jgi:hypothetical protein